MQQLSGRALEAEGPGHEPRRRDELQFDAVLGADAAQDDVFQRAHLLHFYMVNLADFCNLAFLSGQLPLAACAHRCFKRTVLICRAGRFGTFAL